MLSKLEKKIKKRHADIKKRVDGTYWESIKKQERALTLYEQANGKRSKQIDIFIKYVKYEIRRQKAYFFFSEKIARFFYPRITDPYSWQRVLIDSSEQKDLLIFEDLRLPLPINIGDKRVLLAETVDIIIPYLLDNPTITRSLMSFWGNEGPYEIDENICLKKNDIVIDCGANMGLFSAVASSKGCTVYSFEPSSYVIENYLSKTALLNKNINICQYALWDSEAMLDFEMDYEHIGSSKIVEINEPQKTIRVQTIKLDDFVARNNLPRVDFIKADIEGAERNMLRGAAEVLKEFAPKLSICTYHLKDDPEVIRETILDINPKYKIIEGAKKTYAYVP